MMIDRSFSEIEAVVEGKLKRTFTKTLYSIATNNWQVSNIKNFLKAESTYKIISCDPTDDTIDLFASIPVGISTVLAKNKYT